MKRRELFATVASAALLLKGRAEAEPGVIFADIETASRFIAPDMSYGLHCISYVNFNPDGTFQLVYETRPAKWTFSAEL